jgi:formiminotetrahydrofolate cyclodeaminase
MTENTITSIKTAEFVHYVSRQSHAMAGAVIALSAAQAAALGEACLQNSSDLGDFPGPTLGDEIKEMSRIKQSLLDLCDQDARAIAAYVALREAGKPLAGQQLLCRLPTELGQLALRAADILEGSRNRANERVKDDLEMSISLLAGTAQAAMLLLDSNLRIWPEEELLAEFEPYREELEAGIGRLHPVKRIRPKD